MVVQEAGALGLAHTLGLVVQVGALGAVAAVHRHSAGVALGLVVSQRQARVVAGLAVVAERLVACAGNACGGPRDRSQILGRRPLCPPRRSRPPAALAPIGHAHPQAPQTRQPHFARSHKSRPPHRPLPLRRAQHTGPSHSAEPTTQAPPTPLSPPPRSRPPTHCSCPRCSSSPAAGRPVRRTPARSHRGRRRCAGMSPRSCKPGTRTSAGRQWP